MATTGRTLSPGGALLRSSRMFSLPTELSSPPGDFRAASAYQSPTATKAFPTFQTVTVPDNFRQRGDWGFKRNFPLRSTTRTSTPYLRIKQVDSIEHVTDFNSAADHSLTLEKFQEMNVVVSLPPPKNTSATTINRETYVGSVFEDKYDFTALSENMIEEAGHRRWKYKGPWLANLSEGQFLSYIKRHVRGRRPEFRNFLKTRLALILTQSAKQQAMDQGDQGRDQGDLEIKPEDVTDEQIMVFLRNSREHRDELYGIVSKFLDLAPCEIADLYGDMHDGQKKQLEADDSYARVGPPITHPSAGLSYLRTNAFLENHPVYGPQKARPPVKARVMLTQSGVTLVGVGGFVAQYGGYKTFATGDHYQVADQKLPGGAKTWINVTSAHINSMGEAVLYCRDPSLEAALIVQEMQGETRLFHQRPEESAAMSAALEVKGSWHDYSAQGVKPPRAMSNKSHWELASRKGYGDAFTSQPSPNSPESPGF